VFVSILRPCISRAHPCGTSSTARGTIARLASLQEPAVMMITAKGPVERQRSIRSFVDVKKEDAVDIDIDQLTLCTRTLARDGIRSRDRPAKDDA
jgi:hypothetical protein